MYPFLLIKRKYTGEWVFSLWSLLNEDALKGVHAKIWITAVDGKTFSAEVSVLPFLSVDEEEAEARGEHLTLFDRQLVVLNKWFHPATHQTKCLDYQVQLTTTPEFREKLNQDSPNPPRYDFMTDIVSQVEKKIADPNAPDPGPEEEFEEEEEELQG